MYPSNKKKKQWIEEKDRLLKLTLEERRKEYKDYVSLDKIPSLPEELKSKASNNEEAPEESQVKRGICEKVSLYQGDITQLEVDAIVNAANASLLGGGGVDGCIHRASGPCLFAECRTLGGCATGKAKITCGYELPAKFVIHTVGPIARGHLNDTHKEDLAHCYKSSLKLAKENNIRTIAFPCISTGIYGFPNEPAATIALNTVKGWLKKHHNEVDRVIFCVFLEVDFKIYKKEMINVFITDEDSDDLEDDKKEDNEQMNEEAKALSPPTKKSKGKKSEKEQDDQEVDNTLNSEEIKTDNLGSGEENPSPEDNHGLSEEHIIEKSKESQEPDDKGYADEEMSERKDTHGQEDSAKNEDTDHPDITMESQVVDQDDKNAVPASNSPADDARDPVDVIQMKDDDISSCKEKTSEEANQDVEMCSQTTIDSSGDNEETLGSQD